MIFLTADQHYLHEAIIGHCNRPFKTKKEQTKTMISKHNSLVGKQDTVYHIGDVFWGGSEYIHQFRRIMDKLLGTHILILGNHDSLKPFQYVDIGFQSVHTALEIEHAGYRVIMAHDPAIWNAIPKDVIFLHGHVHNLYKSMWGGKKVVNVGVDVWDFYPVLFERILRIIE